MTLITTNSERNFYHLSTVFIANIILVKFQSRNRHVKSSANIWSKMILQENVDEIPEVGQSIF